MKRPLASLLSLVVIVACSPASSPVPSPTSTPVGTASPAPTPSASPTPLASASPSAVAGAIREVRADLGRLATADVSQGPGKAVVTADAGFGLRLYHELVKGGGANLIYSPYSISTALSMTYAGARGTSATQLAAALGVGDDATAWHGGRNDLDAALTRAATLEPSEFTPLTIEPTNAIFGQDGFPFEPSYLELLARAYGAGLEALDFGTDPEAARQAINAWVAVRTKGRIPELLARGKVSGSTRFVLVNAIYFKGSWAAPFEKAQTQAARFHRLDGSTVMTPLMHGSIDGTYVRAKDWQAVEIPYIGATMTVILPDAGRFAAVERGLDSGILDDLTAHPTYTRVHLALPRWSSTTSAELNPALERLGVRDLFDAGKADLSGIADAGLYVSFVVHQANIDVDEAGTEAAAATAVGGDTSGGGPEGEVTVTVDRPFIFLIRDGLSGEILFAGRVLDPTAG